LQFTAQEYVAIVAGVREQVCEDHVGLNVAAGLLAGHTEVCNVEDALANELQTADNDVQEEPVELLVEGVANVEEERHFYQREAEPDAVKAVRHPLLEPLVEALQEHDHDELCHTRDNRGYLFHILLK